MPVMACIWGTALYDLNAFCSRLRSSRARERGGGEGRFRGRDTILTVHANIVKAVKEFLDQIRIHSRACLPRRGPHSVVDDAVPPCFHQTLRQILPAYWWCQFRYNFPWHNFVFSIQSQWEERFPTMYDRAVRKEG